VIKLEVNAGRAIKSFLAEKGCQPPLRIQLQSSGCCDPILCLRADQIRETDLVQEVDELTFVIGPEIYQLLGEVTISYRNEHGKDGFVITSTKPVSEWEGFGVSVIKF
jgi:Fe-S cluster assembly iron-binding protein IscA